MKPTLALTALLLAGCGVPGSSGSPDTAYHLTATDTRFVLAVRTNTQTFFTMDDADLALYGRGVCRVLRDGGVVAQAAAMLPGAGTVRGNLDGTYLANVARQDYCPQFPAVKLAPKG